MYVRALFQPQEVYAGSTLRQPRTSAAIHFGVGGCSYWRLQRGGHEKEHKLSTVAPHVSISCETLGECRNHPSNKPLRTCRR